MACKNSLTDDYISRAEPFARPILKQLRKLVHKAHPEINEEIKWSFPNYTYKGKIICHMASFKEHCAFGFWFSSKLKDPEGVLTDKLKKGGMGSLGRLCALEDLPDDHIIIDLVRESVELVDQGVKLSPKKGSGKKDLKVPQDLRKLLQGNKIASAVFADFSNTHRKEYIEWIEGAKTDVTRTKRLETAIEWIAEGKPRNWKYMKRK